MLRKLLLMSAFVLVGSVATFAQKHGTANCPPDRVQVTREVSVGIGGNGGKITEVSCEKKGNTPIDRMSDKVRETVDRVRGGSTGNKNNRNN